MTAIAGDDIDSARVARETVGLLIRPRAVLPPVTGVHLHRRSEGARKTEVAVEQKGAFVAMAVAA